MGHIIARPPPSRASEWASYARARAETGKRSRAKLAGSSSPDPRSLVCPNRHRVDARNAPAEPAVEQPFGEQTERAGEREPRPQIAGRFQYRGEFRNPGVRL